MMNSINLDKKDTTFMNCGNSKIPDPHRLLINLSDKKYLKRKDKSNNLSNLGVYYAQKYTKKSNKNNKFKKAAPTWNVESELPDGSYYVSDIQDYFVFIF